MSVEYGGALLIGIILLMIAILTAIFPESEDDKFDHKNWHLGELLKKLRGVSESGRNQHGRFVLLTLSKAVYSYRL